MKIVFLNPLLTERVKKHFALNRKIYFLIGISTLIFLKIWLTRAQSVNAVGTATHDDRLFLNIADQLLEGKWLGPFDQLTLAKGMFYPLWVALISILKLPLLLAQQLLYAAACLLLMKAIPSRHLNPIIRLIFFAILFFNPMTYTASSLRVIREGIYPALTLFVVASAIGLITRIQNDFKKTTQWAIGLGMFLSVFWLTREEGLWIFPILAIALGTGFLTAIREWKKILGILLIPFGMLVLSIGIVSTLNYHYYGLFSTVEFKAKPFLSAYGALCRVKHAHWVPDVPVPKEARLRIYQVSPTFSELMPYLEGKIENFWGKNEYNKNLIEIRGGWFMWAFRDAVAAAGHYNSGERAMNFYRKIANEINGACSSGQLACYPERSSMIPPWHSEYLPALAKTSLQSFLFLLRFEEFNVITPASQGDEDLLELFRSITRERLSPTNSIIVQAEGWIFSRSPNFSLTVANSRDQWAEAKYEIFKGSPDVYHYFLNKGLNFENAKKSRFIIRNRVEDIILLRAEVDHQVIRIPLDGSVKKWEDKGLYFNLDFIYPDGTRLPSQNKWVNSRLNILKSIGNLYQMIIPWFFLGAMLICLARTIKRFGGSNSLHLGMIALALFVGILTRIVLLSMVSITSFQGINTIYLAPVYPLVLTFIVVSLLRFFRENQFIAEPFEKFRPK